MAEISMAEASYFAPSAAVLTNFEGVTKAFAKVVVGAEWNAIKHSDNYHNDKQRTGLRGKLCFTNQELRDTTTNSLIITVSAQWF